jgi:hypothetical protein
MNYVNPFLLLIIPVFIHAQSVQIRGKVIDSNKEPVKNLSVRFTSFGDAVTTGSGEFIITVPAGVQFVDVTIRDDNRKLLYPVDAKIPVPSDPNFVTTVIVSGTAPGEDMSMDKSILKFEELESLLKEVGTSNIELKAFLEKFIELESNRISVSGSKLREEFERKMKKISTFSEISRILKEYILRAENLKTNFSMYYEIALVSNPAVEKLNEATGAYNPVYDTIYNNSPGWKAVIRMVKDSALAEDFDSSVNYMIDEIHKPYIFQLNEAVKLINEIRFLTGTASDNSEEKRRRLKRKVETVIGNLEKKLPLLKNHFDLFINKLLHAE